MIGYDTMASDNRENCLDIGYRSCLVTLILLSGGIGPVYAADRNYTTGIHLQGVIGQVPADSAWARVTLNAYLEYGYNDAYADDVSLVISTS